MPDTLTTNLVETPLSSTAHQAQPVRAAHESTTGGRATAPAKKPQWMHYGDYVRIVGTMAVVVGHVADMTLYAKTPLTTEWWICNVWDSLARWAVPVYIMLSGALLLDPAREELPRHFYRKRLARLGVPLVFWSLFFMWLDVYYTGWRATPNPAFEDAGIYLWQDHTRWQWFIYLVFSKPIQAWRNLAVGEPYMHMHFIFRIAGLYAFTPLIRVCLKHLPRPMIVSGVVLMLVLSSADSVTNNFTGTKLSAFARFVPFLGYYLTGYLLRDPQKSRRWLGISWLGLILTIAMLALGTGWLADYAMKNDHITQVSGPPSLSMLLYDFLSPVRVVMAVCAWIVLTNLFHNPIPEHRKVQKVVRFFANTTLGLYLIHPLFREMWYMGMQFMDHKLLAHGIDANSAMWNPGWFGPSGAAVLGVPGTAILVYLPSLVATIILMNIPFVRRITG